MNDILSLLYIIIIKFYTPVSIPAFSVMAEPTEDGNILIGQIIINKLQFINLYLLFILISAQYML